jgi:hypothetical protein
MRAGRIISVEVLQDVSEIRPAACQIEGGRERYGGRGVGIIRREGGGFWGHVWFLRGRQDCPTIVMVFALYFVQLRIAPQNPKTP